MTKKIKTILVIIIPLLVGLIPLIIAWFSGFNFQRGPDFGMLIFIGIVLYIMSLIFIIEIPTKDKYR